MSGAEQSQRLPNIMSTLPRRLLGSLKVKTLSPPRRLPSPQRSTSADRESNPLEKQLMNISLHILRTPSRRTPTPSEPTLIFDSFLYLGGMQALTNKVRLSLSPCPSLPIIRVLST